MRHKKPFLLMILAILGLLIVACSPSAEKLNNDGNDKFAEEAYLEALAAYQKAQIESPELAEPYYNAANALYRQGAYQEALDLMEKALSFAGAESLAESSQFNKGNIAYNTQAFEDAIADYTKTLLLNPDDQDAKYNLELALQQLQQQQEEQQQEQDQQDQQQEQNQDQQQDQSQDGQGQEDEQQQEQPENGQQQDQNQDQQQDQSQDNQSQENDQQQEQQQPQDGQQQEEQNQDGQGQPQDGQNQEQQPPSQIPQPGQRMTAEQAKQLLAAIAENSETLQEKLGQMFVVPPIPPVQDW